MNKKTPFQLKTSFRSKISDFYWRGGDSLKEREYIIDQYDRALREKTQKELELQKLEAEIESAKKMLSMAEGYTASLAVMMDDDAAGVQEEASLKKELADIEKQIDECENELKVYTSLQNPALASSLQKERAHYLLEIQKDEKELEEIHANSEELKRELKDYQLSQNYERIYNYELKHVKLFKKGNALRKILNQIKNEFDITKQPRNIPNSADAIEARNMYNKGLNTAIEIEMLDLKLKRMKSKHITEIGFYISIINEINHRLKENNKSDECVDIEELKSKYIPNDDDIDDEDVQNINDFLHNIEKEKSHVKAVKKISKPVPVKNTQRNNASRVSQRSDHHKKQ